MSDNVWETKALTKMEKSEEAKKLLDRLASICAPAMARRSWRVKCLKEFYPKNAGLLGMNVNKGVSIFIRLRPDRDKNSFLPWGDLLGTMVHELTHIGIGSHSADFYKLMDEIYDEVEKDAGAKGTEKKSIAGAIFMTKSHRLGGEPVPPRTSSSKTAYDAAFKRLQNTGRSASSGQKLGGTAIVLSSLTPANRRQLAAYAADRRLKDDLWCNDSAIADCDGKLKIDLNLGEDPLEPTPKLVLRQHSDSKQKMISVANPLVNRLRWICQNCDTVNEEDKRDCIFCASNKGSVDQNGWAKSNAYASIKGETELTMGKRRHQSPICDADNDCSHRRLKIDSHSCSLCSIQSNRISSSSNSSNIKLNGKANSHLITNQGTSSSHTTSSSLSSLHFRNGVTIIDLVDSDDDKSTSESMRESVSHTYCEKFQGDCGYNDDNQDVVIIRDKI